MQKQQELICKKENIFFENFPLDTENQPHLSTCFDSKDLSVVAHNTASHSPQEIHNSKFDLSLSASSSSLSSDFSLYSSSSSFSTSLNANQDDQIENKNVENVKRKRTTLENDEKQTENALETQMVSMNSMSLNSDLEIEVASTLVGMKWAGK